MGLVLLLTASAKAYGLWHLVGVPIRFALKVLYMWVLDRLAQAYDFPLAPSLVEKAFQVLLKEAASEFMDPAGLVAELRAECSLDTWWRTSPDAIKSRAGATSWRRQ